MKKSRLEWGKQRKLVNLFLKGEPVRSAASIAEVNKNTAASYFSRLRKLILLKDSPNGLAEISLAKGNKLLDMIISRSRARNIEPIGLSFMNDKLQIALMPDTAIDRKKVPLRGEISPDNLFMYAADGGKYCVILPQPDSNEMVRVNQCKFQTCPMKEGSKADSWCCMYARTQKNTFGIPKSQHHLHLKELEWRFNNPEKSDQRRQLFEWVSEELA